jgi:hypothetical protein
MAERSMGSMAVFGVVVVVNLILTILAVDQITSARGEIEDLKQELASKQDIAMLRPIRVTEVLEERCQRCHTDRRFAATWDMDPTEILTTIQRMRSHPGGEAIPVEEVPRIEAALIMLRCTSCHGEEVLSRALLMPVDERERFLRTKVAMPRSGFRPDQAGEVIRAFERLASDYL